jgi:pimeloyl-ACP methyl ester carboxylesterase
VFTDNAGVRIHALDNEVDDTTLPPVVVVPGMGESAEEYAWLLDALGNRRVLIVDVRGRGQSDAPEQGYRWEDHYGDLAAMVAARALDRPILVAFSRGSSYALGYALSNPNGVRGLAIGDYWARHVGLPAEFGERQLAVVLRGVPMSERMPAHAVHGVARESREVPLWDRVQELECPVLVIRGGRRGVIVSDEGAAQWEAALPSVEFAMLADAGHDLWSRDRDAYLAVLRPFLERCR